MKQLKIDVAANGVASYGIPIQSSDGVYSGDTGTSAVDITVPTGATTAVFECDGNFWLREGSTATIPTTWGTGSGHESELIIQTAVRSVTSGGTISIITAATQKMSIQFYS